MDDYVSKPIDLEMLAAALRRSRRLTVDERSRPGQGSPSPDYRAGGEATPSRGTGEPAAIDPAALGAFASELGGTAAEVVAEIVETYLQDTPELIRQMRDAVRAGDASALDRAAHTLKSSSATVGAVPLAARCRAIEEQARGGRVSDMGEAVLGVEAEFERVRQELESGIAA
jgi:HPt (histidine-containing phosphotransfer) domain-containing protein